MRVSTLKRAKTMDRAMAGGGVWETRPTWRRRVGTRSGDGDLSTWCDVSDVRSRRRIGHLSKLLKRKWGIENERSDGLNKCHHVQTGRKGLMLLKCGRLIA